jgi:hypothetical protein
VGPHDVDFSEVWTAEASPTASVRDVAYARIDARPAAVAVTGTSLTVWDLESGQRLASVDDADQGDDLACVVVTDIGGPDGGQPVAVTGDTAGRLQTWDLRSGERIGKPVSGSGGMQALAARQGAGAGLALVARGPGATSTVYSVPVADESVEVWDVAAAQQVRRLGHGGYTDSIAIGEHDGRALAVASATFSARPLIDSSDAQSLAFVWDPATGERIGGPLEPEQADALIGSVAVGAVDGRTIVVGQSGDGLCVWRAGESGQVSGQVRPEQSIPIPGRVGFVAWAGTARRPLVLVGGGGLRPDTHCWLRVWDPRDWRLLGHAEPGYGVLTRCAAAPDGRVILPWGRSVKVLRYA